MKLTTVVVSLSSICLCSLFSVKGVSSSTVICPGQLLENYCDCEGDCTGQPEWCSCEEAQKCCKGATSPTVLCEGQPKENYCDCEGDCTDQPEWCACEEAQKCCSSKNIEDGTTTTTTPTNDLQLAFHRYSGTDGKMDHDEWDVFVRNMELLSCDDGMLIPAVNLILKDSGDNYADCDGEYPLLYGERWNNHEVYVNKTKDRILMFRWGSWLVTGYHWWDDFQRTGGEGMGGGFQQSKLGATDSIEDSRWDNYNVTLSEVQAECTESIERKRIDTIWDDVSSENQPYLSFDHFLTALERIALDRKDKHQDGNTIREIYQWIVQIHINEEHMFCHSATNDDVTNGSSNSSDSGINKLDVLLFNAFVFACGIIFGLVTALSMNRPSTVYLPLTPPKDSNESLKNHTLK